MDFPAKRPEFLARIVPGQAPVATAWPASTEAPDHPRIDSLPPSFIFADPAKTRFGDSNTGRLLGGIIGDARLPQDIAQADCIAAWLLAAFDDAEGVRLASINGSWRAFLYDADSGRTLVATDRMGTRRTCVFEGSESLVLGSDAEWIDRLSGNSSGFSIDPSAILHYFYFHCIPAPQSVFAGIRVLNAATATEWDGSAMRSRRYWNPAFASRPAAPVAALREELLDTLSIAVDDAVDERPIATFLSGGLDSSTVLGMAAKRGRRSVNAYSIGFDEEGYDETMYAELAAKHFGTNLKTYYVTPADVISTIELVASAYDEPFGNSSAIPTYHCALAAKRAGESVLLAGDGGDELFAGNERYRTQLIFSYYFQVPRLLRERVLEPLFLRTFAGTSLLPIRKIRRYIEQALVPMPDRLQTYNFLSVNPLEAIFTGDFLETVSSDSPSEHVRHVYGESTAENLVDRMLYLDWQLTLTDNDIRKVFTMCQAAEIDVRFPMLDNKLLDLACRIPGNVKMKHARLRGFYKDATRNFLPKEILTKQKHGFGLPFGPWFSKSKSLRNFMLDLVDSFADRNIVKREYIDEVRKATMGSHPGYYGEMIWLLAIFESWLSRRAAYRDFRI